MTLYEVYQAGGAVIPFRAYNGLLGEEFLISNSAQTSSGLEFGGTGTGNSAGYHTFHANTGGTWSPVVAVNPPPRSAYPPWPVGMPVNPVPSVQSLISKSLTPLGFNQASNSSMPISGKDYNTLRVEKEERLSVTCECGAHSIGANSHSAWCPMHSQGNGSGGAPGAAQVALSVQTSPFDPALQSRIDQARIRLTRYNPLW